MLRVMRLLLLALACANNSLVPPRYWNLLCVKHTRAKRDTIQPSETLACSLISRDPIEGKYRRRKAAET